MVEKTENEFIVSFDYGVKTTYQIPSDTLYRPFQKWAENTLSEFEAGRTVKKITWGPADSETGSEGRKALKGAKSFKEAMKTLVKDKDTKRVFIEVEHSEAEAKEWSNKKG